MTTTEGNSASSTNVVDVSAPGAVPFVELSATNFGEILSLTESMSSQGWVVTTPAGPMVLGYKQVKSILRNPEWISLLSSFSALDQMENGISDFNVMLEQAQRIVPKFLQRQNAPNVLSVEGKTINDFGDLLILHSPLAIQTTSCIHEKSCRQLGFKILENGGGNLYRNSVALFLFQ